MDTNLVCVKYFSALNEAAKKTFKRMHRVKLTSFSVSSNFLAFGASSGGIYVFQRECSKFLKFIPNKESPITLISISKDETNLAMATSKGLIVVIEHFLIESDSQSKMYQEHQGTDITSFYWHGIDLYIGDSRGRVSVITAGIDILPKTIFQLPLTTILHLDSAIVQIDIFRHYLLVSTRTRTYLCDTQKEFYKPIGKKARDGFFGACFYGPKLDAGCSTDESNSFSDKARGIYKTFAESEFEEESDINNECVIFCARPGVRLWQANFDGSVEVTYQFKNSMQQMSSTLLLIGQEEKARLQIVAHTDTSAPKNNFNFGRIFPVCNRLILSYTVYGLYVFDPQASELRFWIDFHCDIKQVEISDSIIFLWTTDLEINLISLVQLEELILRCLYKKQYLLCADICLHFSDTILDLLKSDNKLYLLSALKDKITEEKLLEKLGPIFYVIKKKNEILSKNDLEIEVEDTEWETLNPSDLIRTEKSPILVGNFDNKKEENKEMDLFVKQYKLHKTHRNINIPDFEALMERSDIEDIFALISDFVDHVSKEYSEDATNWCQELILKLVLFKHVKLKSASKECVEFIQNAFLESNKDLAQYSCLCGHPLPNCHNFKPKHYNIGLDLLDGDEQKDIVLKKVPYFVKVSTSFQNHSNAQPDLNLPLTVQFCDKELFSNRLTEFTYDVWDQVIRLYIKLNKGRCLNCDRKINVEGILTWTEIAMLILQSIGARNTLKLFERYSNCIPNGSLDHKFYQTCIFMTSFDCESTCQDIKSPVDFVNNLDKVSLLKFQKSLQKHLEKKYLETEAPPISAHPNNTGQSCSYCNLPLNNAIVGNERRFILECGHQFHSLCFSRNNRQCNICR